MISSASASSAGSNSGGLKQNNGLQFGRNFSANSFVYIGGLPSFYSTKLSSLALPSAVFEPRFRGSIRNIVYADDDTGRPRRQEVMAYKVSFLISALFLWYIVGYILGLKKCNILYYCLPCSSQRLKKLTLFWKTTTHTHIFPGLFLTFFSPLCMAPFFWLDFPGCVVHKNGGAMFWYKLYYILVMCRTCSAFSWFARLEVRFWGSNSIFSRF